MKYLLVLLVVLLVLWLLGSRRKRREENRTPSQDAARKQAGKGTAMIACAHCGLHVPEQEALHDAVGRAFCGEEHRRLGAG